MLRLSLTKRVRQQFNVQPFLSRTSSVVILYKEVFRRSQSSSFAVSPVLRHMCSTFIPS